MEPIKIGLLGLGNVGGGVWEILQQNSDLIASRAGGPLQIAGIAVQQIHKERQVQAPQHLLTTDAQSLLNDPSIPILVETIGCCNGSPEPALSYIKQALLAGKHVVTANKEVLAKHAVEIHAAAATGGGSLYYEAAVAGGIPIVKAFRESLTGNQVQTIIGIINGTTNYMLTRMEREEMEFGEVLAQAQALGYAEADPSSDVEGYDAAYKIVLLASIAFGTEIDVANVYCEGITRITLEDFRYASELGFRVKLLAVAKERNGVISVRVHPAMIPVTHPLAAVNDVFNAVFVHGDAVGDLMFYGRGAGMMPTGSAVVADCVDAAKNLRRGVAAPALNVSRQIPICDVNDIIGRYYLNLKVVDRPGVLAAIATALGQAGVSIASLVQKGRSEDPVGLVIITHSVMERNVRQALEQIALLPEVRAIASVIRVEGE